MGVEVEIHQPKMAASACREAEPEQMEIDKPLEEGHTPPALNDRSSFAKQSLNTARPLRLLSSEYNDRFMRKVVGNMGKIQGVNLDKVRQSNFIKNSSAFSSTGLLKTQRPADNLQPPRNQSAFNLGESPIYHEKLAASMRKPRAAPSHASNFEDRLSLQRRQYSLDQQRHHHLRQSEILPRHHVSRGEQLRIERE